MLQNLRFQLDSDTPVHNIDSVLRFAAHLIVFLYNMSLLPITDAVISIIKKYSWNLRKDSGALIPYFLLLLPREHQRDAYCLCLQDVIDGKLEYYNNGKDHGLEMDMIVKMTVEAIFQRGGLKENTDNPPSLITSVSGTVSRSDLIQIRTLEWLAFEPEQALDLLQYSNFLIRLFLLHGRIHAVKDIIKRYPVPGATDELEHSLEERVQYSNLVDCFSSYDSWTNIYKTKPKEEGGALVRWKVDIEKHTQRTVELFENLLGGDVFGIAFEGTGSEFEMIRQIYIPDIILLQHSILFQTIYLCPT